MHRCSVDYSCGIIYVSIEGIAAIKKHKQNAMRVSLNVSASNNRAHFFLAPAANSVFLILFIFQMLFRIHVVSVIKCY